MDTQTKTNKKKQQKTHGVVYRVAAQLKIQRGTVNFDSLEISEFFLITIFLQKICSAAVGTSCRRHN